MHIDLTRGALTTLRKPRSVVIRKAQASYPAELHFRLTM